MTQPTNDGNSSWELYAKPGLLSIASKVAEDDGEWILLTIKTEMEAEDGVAISSDFACPECGCQPTDQDDTHAIQEIEAHKVTLKLKIEELPRFVAALNETYLAITSKRIVIPKFDRLGEWEGRESRFASLLLVEPLFSRREPESRPEDFQDRIAVLHAFGVISARLSDDARKIGLLQPIG